MQIARFRGRTANDITLVIAASTDPSRLYRNAEMSSGTLNWSLRMGEPSRMRLMNSDTMQVRLPAPRSAEQVWIRDVKPGNYRVRVEAVDPSIISAAGRAQDEIDAKVIVPGALMLSDVLLGHKTSAPNGSINGLNDVSLLPRGNLTMKQNEQFTLYWENYGLIPDSTGRVKFDVKIVIRLLEIDRTSSNHVGKLFGSISDAVGISPIGEQAMGVNYSREEVLGSRDRVPQVFTLGLGSAPKGKYRLEMTIIDKVTKSTARSDRVFFLDGK
jgi:hypothetical protein